MIVGDLLVSSGLGGVYPPGYPVAKVTAVTRDSGQPLLAVEAEPLAGLDRDPEVLLVWFDNEVLEPPAESEAAAPAGRAGCRAGATCRPRVKRDDARQKHELRLGPRRRPHGIRALAASVAPLPSFLEPYRPNFVALTVLWFCLLSPRLLGLTYAWCAGLALDGFQGVLLASMR